MNKWSLYEAKNKLSSIVDIAVCGKPQCITKHGNDAAVVIGIDEYLKLKTPKISLGKFLLQSPKFDD